MKNENSETSIKQNLSRLLSAAHMPETDVKVESRNVTVTRTHTYKLERDQGCNSYQLHKQADRGGGGGTAA